MTFDTIITATSNKTIPVTSDVRRGLGDISDLRRCVLSLEQFMNH